jgi:hypothetical protein
MNNSIVPPPQIIKSPLIVNIKTYKQESYYAIAEPTLSYESKE